MKLLLILSLIVTAAALTSCSESAASEEHEDAPQQSGAVFKAGQGISLTTLMAESIGLKTTEVAEDAQARVIIPRSALLTTVEGHFVFAGNGDFYLRTPVKLGSQSANGIVITDGLYAGDEVVSAAVMSLWLTELQYLRGGKACACAD